MTAVSPGALEEAQELTHVVGPLLLVAVPDATLTEITDEVVLPLVHGRGPDGRGPAFRDPLQQEAGRGGEPARGELSS
jgi:hypothetical protein